jgi:hypothetical protein
MGLLLWEIGVRGMSRLAAASLLEARTFLPMPIKAQYVLRGNASAADKNLA